MSQEFKPFNINTDPAYNREPGIVIVDGSNYQKEMAKFEQFHGRLAGSVGPGNPYTYRPFPKMLYRAEHWNGKVCCMAAPPDAAEYVNPAEYERADLQARKFTERCQKTVQNEQEMSRAMEDGWREGPQEAVDYLLSRDRDKGVAAAHRNYEDRNLSEKAKAESAAAEKAAGEHIGEIPRQPVRRVVSEETKAKMKAAWAKRRAKGTAA